MGVWTYFDKRDCIEQHEDYNKVYQYLSKVNNTGIGTSSSEIVLESLMLTLNSYLRLRVP